MYVPYAPRSLLLRSRDLPLPGLVLFCLGLIWLHLAGTRGQADATSGGWRHIDTESLTRRIDTGDLRDLRADWFHPTRPDELPAGFDPSAALRSTSDSTPGTASDRGPAQPGPKQVEGP